MSEKILIVDDDVDSLKLIGLMLKKQGYEPVEDSERSAWFKVPKKCVSIRKPKVLTEKQKTNLTKRAVFMRNALINSRKKAPNSLEQGVGSHEARISRDSLKLQGQNGEKGASLGE